MKTWNITIFMSVSLTPHKENETHGRFDLRATQYLQEVCTAREFMLTNFMELSRSWVTTSYADIQEYPNILWSPKVHYLLLVSILSQNSPVHTIPSYLRSTLILSTHPHVDIPSGSFLPACPPISYMHPSSPHSCYMLCHFILLDLIIVIMLGEE
jgi:hypothetical protein